MKKEDAIKFLQQLYPNGGHCWLDEQRIEAIDMAVKALQEEPVNKDKFTFTSLPRLLDRIKPTDRVKWYSSRLADALEKEGYITDAKIVRESIKLMNGEKVPMATMDEEPVSEDLPHIRHRDTLDEFAYQCAYDLSNDWAKETPTWNDVEMACKLGANWQKEQFEKNRLAACDKQTEEEAEIEQSFLMGIIECEHRQPTFDDAIKYGMRLQRENMMKDATDVTVHIEAGNYPYIPQMELYDYDKDVPLAKEGDKYKVVLIKEG